MPKKKDWPEVLPRSPGLQKILDAHHEWVESNGERGARLNLADADLRKADMRGSRFDGADMRQARFWGADMSDADTCGLRDARGVIREKAPPGWREMSSQTAPSAKYRVSRFVKGSGENER
jgi:Pentapeptide repeats (8 copies)